MITPRGASSRGLSGSNYKNKTKTSFVAQYWGYDGADAPDGANWLVINW